jgi:hypothetical protein
MAGGLDFCHNLLDDLLKVMRAEDQSLGLKLLDFVRLDTTSIRSVNIWTTCFNQTGRTENRNEGCSK